MRSTHTFLIATLTLIVAATAHAGVTWDASGDNNWTAGTDNTSWSGDTYNTGDDAVFDGSGTGTVNVDGAGVSPGNVSLSSGTYEFTGGPVNATDWTLSGGELQWNGSGVLGSGDINVTGNASIFSTKTGSAATMSNDIVVSNGVDLTIKQNNNNSSNPNGTTVGSISGGTTANPITVSLDPTGQNSQRWRLSSSTFVGQVNITDNSIIFHNFDTSHFGDVNNTVRLGGFPNGMTLAGGGTIEQDIEIGNDAKIGSSFGGTTTVNGQVSTFGDNEGEIRGTLRLTNSANNFGVLKLSDSTLEFTYVHANGGTLRGQGNNPSIVRLVGALTGTSNARFINTGNGVFVMDVAAAGADVTWVNSWDTNGSNKPLEKTGAGTVRLAGGGNLRGSDLDVTGGTMLVNSNLSNVSTATVANGATFGGTGTLNGNVVIEDGATLAPGNSTGTFAINGDLDLDGTYEVEIGDLGSSDFDQTTSISDLVLGPDSVLNAIDLDGWEWGDWYPIMQYSSLTGTFGSTSNVFKIDYGSGSNDWIMIQVPEPVSLALVAATGLVLGLRRRR